MGHLDYWPVSEDYHPLGAQRPRRCTSRAE